MIKLWHRPGFQAVVYNDQMELVENIQEIVPNDKVPNVVIDLMQGSEVHFMQGTNINSCCTMENILEYNKIFDRIVLVNCDTSYDILKIIEKFDLPKVYFLTVGEVNYKPQHMKIIEGLETCFGEVRKLYFKTNYKSLEDLKPMASKNLYFDALLGMVSSREHREFVYQKIIQNNLNDKFYTRIQTPGDTLEFAIANNKWDWPRDAVLIPLSDQNDWYSARRVGFANTDINTNISNIVPVDIYNNTCYSIVAETWCSSDFVMPTEKTAKCLIAKRLFVMFAGVGYLAHLRRLGFQTFDSVIDESYDLEPNDKIRWQMAFEQVEYLCNQPQQMILQKIQSVLEHNYNLFVGRDWNAEFEQAIIAAITEF